MVFNRHNSKKKNKRGFTLVEMLIIAPIVILVIGTFISAIIRMTGSVLVSRGANVLSYSINDALTRIDQDVKASAGFLAANNITLTAGQGFNGGTELFQNASVANGNMIVLNAYATDKNPLTSTRNIIDATNSPYACSNQFVSQNSKVMTNIVYFVKNGILWRRVIMPSNYSSGGGCVLPWQKPTCTPGYSAVFCKANDQKLVENVTSFDPTYWTNSVPPTAIPIASNSGQTDSARQTAMQTASSVNITITATKKLSGQNVTQTGSTRSLGITAPTMLTQPTNQTVTAGVAANFTSAAYGTNLSVKWEQSSDQGNTWTAIPGQTLPTLSVSGTTGGMDGNLYHAIYTNSYGQIISSPAKLTVNASGWNSLSYWNLWSDYAGGYNAGGFMKTSSGVVVLRGLIKRTGTPTQGEIIAYLPVGYRPTVPLLFGISTNPNTSGRVDIYPDGRVIFQFGNLTWLSLENIHFIADAGRYTSTPISTFYSGWSSYGYTWGKPSYIIDSIGRVNLQGLLQPGTRGDGVRILDLPSNLRPSAYAHIPEYGGGFSGMGIDSRPGYSTIVDKNLGSAYLTINTTFYPASYDAGWTNLTLLNGWAHYAAGYSTPQYRKASDGLVSIKGLIRSGTATDETIIATLPSNCRPVARGLFATYANGTVARVDIDPTGNIRWKSGANAWYSLDGITFFAENTLACP